MNRFFISIRWVLAAGLLLLGRPAPAQNTQLVIDQATTLPSLATPGSGSILDLAEYTDALGNTYQAASFSGSVHFGSFTFISPDASAEVVVAKRNAAGTYQWAMTGGGTGTQRAKALAVDAAGNVYVTGFFDSATASFGSSTLTNRRPANSGTSDIFVLKVSPGGTWDWAVSAGGGTTINGNDYATAIAVDALGGVYVAGTFTSSVAFFGSIQVPSPDLYGRDIVFVAKLSSSGIWQWVSNSNGPGNIVRSVAAEPTGATYLSGECSGYISYGPFLLLNPGGKQVQFIAKLDPAGTWTWLTKSIASRTAGGYSQHFGVVLDGLNSAYITGIFSCDTLKFGSTALTNTGPRVPPAYTDRTKKVFVAKLDVTTGRWRWAVQSRGDGDESMGGPVFDAQGNLYVGGAFSAPPGSSGQGTGSQFGTTTLFSAGGNDIVVAQLDTAGRWLWARRAGGPDNEGAGPRRIDAQGRVHIAGSFFGPSLPLGTTTLTAAPTASYTNYTTFTARLGANGPLAVRSGAAALFEVYPNPARTAVTVAGLPPGQVVLVLDIVGRLVLRGVVPPRGALQLALPLGLPAGVYVVRAGTQTQRLVVE